MLQLLQDLLHQLLDPLLGIVGRLPVLAEQLLEHLVGQQPAVQQRLQNRVVQRFRRHALLRRRTGDAVRDRRSRSAAADPRASTAALRDRDRRGPPDGIWSSGISSVNQVLRAPMLELSSALRTSRVRRAAIHHVRSVGLSHVRSVVILLLPPDIRHLPLERRLGLHAARARAAGRFGGLVLELVGAADLLLRVEPFEDEVDRRRDAPAPAPSGRCPIRTRAPAVPARRGRGSSNSSAASVSSICRLPPRSNHSVTWRRSALA